MIVEDKLQLIMAKMITTLSTMLNNFFLFDAQSKKPRPFFIGKIFQCNLHIYCSKVRCASKYFAALLTNVIVGIKDL
jgi:hypothetical protein